MPAGGARQEEHKRNYQEERNSSQRCRGRRADLEQHFGQPACHQKRTSYAENGAEHREHERLPQHHTEHGALFGAESHADAELAGPLIYRVRHDTIDAHRSNQQRHNREHDEQGCREARLSHCDPPRSISSATESYE